MGVLVHGSFTDEGADGVVISKVSTETKDLGINVVVNPDDASVTNPDIPNLVPDAFSYRYNPATQAIPPLTWLTHSNLSGGKEILSATELAGLGKQIDLVRKAFIGHFGEVMQSLDIEIKRNSQGALLMNQARPFYQ